MIKKCDVSNVNFKTVLFFQKKIFIFKNGCARACPRTPIYVYIHARARAYERSAALILVIFTPFLLYIMLLERHKIISLNIKKITLNNGLLDRVKKDALFLERFL